MLATVIIAALVCLGSLLVGQAVLRICGTRTWSPLAGPVGLSALMLVAVPALHVPGRSLTVAVALAVLVIAAAAAAVRDKEMRPQAGELLAAVPVLLLVWVPFATAGHSGTLGVSFDNDMASHLGWAEAYRSAEIASVLPVHPTYPLGAHALVAAMAQSLGVSVDHAFAGLTAAIPVLLGLTALAAVSRAASWPARTAVVTLAGMPFLVAGYYGQGSFKELIQVLLVLGVTLELRRFGEARGRLRWLPLGIMVLGTLSVYSIAGLVWPVAIATVWLAGLALSSLLAGRSQVRMALTRARAEVGPLMIAAGLTFVLLVPQLPRLVRFFHQNAGINGTGIETSDLGNLVGRIPVWEAFGAWDNPDYRMPSVDAFHSGMWTMLIVGLVAGGTVWWLRQRDWILPAAAGACLLIWGLADRTQSPYIAAKALVIVSPFLILLAARPLVEVARWRERTPGWWLLAAPLLAAVLVFKSADSSWKALRLGIVGPRDHLVELRQLRPLLEERPTLFLGNDDFIRWELAGVPASAPVVGIPQLPIRPEKTWEYGQALDLDSVDADVLNDYQWVITTRDAAGSAPPPQLREVRRTRSFTLWRRTGTVQPRSLLAEGPVSAAKLDCRTAKGRAISRLDGEAAIREPGVSVPVAPLPVGAAVTVHLPLTAGAWDLDTPYDSSVPLEVSYAGVSTTLPAHADRPGPRWPIGRITIDRPTTLAIRLHARKPWFGRANVINPVSVIATPVGGDRVVPLHDACDKLVDWYRPRGE